MKRIAVIGAGSWGTVLGVLLSKLGHAVNLWARRPVHAEEINRTRENKAYLPGIPLPPDMMISSSMLSVLEAREIVLSVIPSHTVRQIYELMGPHLNADMIFISATKGIENESLQRMSEVIACVLRPRFTPRVAALSGPSFAWEVVTNHPTAIVTACDDENIARLIQNEMSGRNLRIYTNTDMIGVEIGGAVKNIIAIAAGVITGLGFGSNTLAGLITRGLAEIKRLAVALGGKKETLAGLAGLGDLVLTCTGHLSRNRSVGIKIAQGKKLNEIVRGMTMIAEGVKTTKSALNLAMKLGVEMPITKQMYEVMYDDKSPKLAIQELMERELKGE